MWKRLSQLSLIDAKEPVGLGERSSMNCAAISGARTVKRLTMLSREQQKQQAISRLAQLEGELLDLKKNKSSYGFDLKDGDKQRRKKDIFRKEVAVIAQKAVVQSLS